jgi:putative transposase
MRQSRFNESQIIGILKEQEASSPTGDVCRKHGISPRLIYNMGSTSGQ